MSPYILSAAIVVASIVMYQICMKTLPVGINPVSALLTFYVSAFICTLIAGSVLRLNENLFSVSQFTWPAVLVGIAIVGIEFGYLYMYRSGWTLAAAPLLGMGGAAVILTLVGYLWFQQPMSLRYILGIVLCLAGLYLLSPQK